MFVYLILILLFLVFKYISITQKQNPQLEGILSFCDDVFQILYFGLSFMYILYIYIRPYYSLWHLIDGPYLAFCLSFFFYTFLFNFSEFGATVMLCLFTSFLHWFFFILLGPKKNVYNFGRPPESEKNKARLKKKPLLLLSSKPKQLLLAARPKQLLLTAGKKGV